MEKWCKIIKGAGKNTSFFIYKKTLKLLIFYNLSKKEKNNLKQLVTPIYIGENKLATGIEIEAKSVEEERVSFNKFIYNVQDYFEKESLNSSKGELYIVKNKYENDNEYHRYKVAQYKDNLECKYIAFEKDLPENVRLGDVVRKIDGKYIYDRQATQYVNNYINKIKRDIINNREE